LKCFEPLDLSKFARSLEYLYWPIAVTVRKEYRLRGSRKNARHHFFLLVLVILLADETGCSYLHLTSPNGKISVQAVSWTLVKKLAEPNAGLSGHKVTILNPVDQSVIASATTDKSGIVEFEVPEGTYTLVGASDEPQSVQVEAGRTVSFKLVVH
jgi:hypothetical protein